MIISFKCIETKKIWYGELSCRLPGDIQLTARRKLRMLDAACALKDLMVPPANRLKPLKGDLIDRYSLRINNQWRLCFSWHDHNAHEVEIIDYH